MNPTTQLISRAACATVFATLALAGCGTYSGSGVSTPVQSHTQTEVQPKAQARTPAGKQAAVGATRDFDYDI